jgi:hypothetical protein
VFFTGIAIPGTLHAKITKVEGNKVTYQKIHLSKPALICDPTTIETVAADGRARLRGLADSRSEHPSPAKLASGRRCRDRPGCTEQPAGGLGAADAFGARASGIDKTR